MADTTTPTARKNKGGRPTKFRPEFLQAAEKLGHLGATDQDVADVLGVSLSCVEKWKVAHPAFAAALKSGKAVADDRVEQSLYRRALGFSHKAVKILAVSHGPAGSSVEQVPYIERYPPDTTACIFWLKNRRPDQWRDKQAIELSADDSLSTLIAQSFNRPKPAAVTE